MLAGGGPVITADTGGILEAVGDTALIVPVDDPDAIADAIDHVALRSAAGALVQEAIDVAAVLNALRVSWSPRELSDIPTPKSTDSATPPRRL